MNILILGNGQLGQMLGRSAVHYGHACLLVDTKTDQVMPVAAYEALPMSLQQAADWADVISWEHEQLAPAHVQICADKFLSPTDKILMLTDRQLEKQLCDDLGIVTSPWSAFQTRDELAQLLADTQQAVVIKAAQGGYDGRSQWRYQPGDDTAQILQGAGQQPGIVENMIPFECEVSLVGARNAAGTTCCYPLVENVHTQGILSYTLAGLSQLPAHLQQQAEQAFQRLTDELSYVGTLAIEFFVVGEGNEARLLVNEVAPRVHNSGHWSLSGCNCDQFDLHIRSLTNTPYPKQLATTPTLMVNVIGSSSIAEELWQDACADPYWYGKAPRAGRKLGHVNFQVDNKANAKGLARKWQSPLQKLA
ncbi:phosphoribosylaminoimidazole carboxylase [Aliidiomarina minuta]|uniref:N5-carboxyaminoimidazole ribonucleotide synthase n=1 Tax=Aliidiomarina minuta TaxID=880057 RepID=A0A432W9L3_9GAMM|nr:ATP-grasp domain-containing protein [Aliidiomarina minuta]RUO26843.1 phosphoribosylaminoimidazole carboxylase [Aliidiomarina minuta]